MNIPIWLIVLAVIVLPLLGAAVIYGVLIKAFFDAWNR